MEFTDQAEKLAQVQQLWRRSKKAWLFRVEKILMQDSFQALLSFVIPEGVSDYFKLANYTKEGQSYPYLFGRDEPDPKVGGYKS